MKTIYKLSFIFLLITPLCLAQTYDKNPDFNNSTVSARSQNQKVDDLEYWELFFAFDVTTASGGSGNAGAAFDGTYFYTTRWASNLMHKYDINGNFIEEFSIPGVWYLRDLAFDGTYMYGGYYSTIYKMDFNTKTLVGTIQSPVQVGFIAYEPARDAFWCGDWYDNPTLVSRSGTVLSSFCTGLQAQSGAACDGQFLYIFDQGQGPGFPQIISQWNFVTGLPTGEFIEVTEDITGTNGVAGGLFSPEGIGYGPAAVGGILVGYPDMLFIYSNHWYIPPYVESFDAFITGQRTACQKPLYWTTWNLTPCDTIMDPFISSTQYWSYPNSVIIAENNDLVQRHQWLTYGIWNVEFMFYIPTGKTGQFGLMSQFDSVERIWGMECHFDQGGAGKLFIGDTVSFTWTENTWQPVNVMIDLEDDQAVMNLGNNTIASWQWSQGGAIPCKLAETDFRGFENSEMYIDNYHFSDYVPVELISFMADVRDGSVALKWQTATENNNSGFEIQRKTDNVDWRKVGFVEGHGTTTEPNSYSFTDKNISTGIYHYRLKQIDYDGSIEYSNEVEVEVAAPLEFSLEQNYPNPFNPSTTIKYSVPQSAQVQIKVFDVLGNEIETLLNEEKQTGVYKLTWNAEQLPSGVYFYTLKAGPFTQTKKMILMK
jgi:hypothetical protein